MLCIILLTIHGYHTIAEYDSSNRKIIRVQIITIGFRTSLSLFIKSLVHCIPSALKMPDFQPTSKAGD